jgi:LysM repeat protein
MANMRKILLICLLGWIFISVAPVRAREPLSVMAGRQRVDTDPYSLINEVNVLRAASGLPAYSINSILMSTAQAHASYMAATGVVSHTGAGGTTPSQRLLAAGYPLAGDLSLGGFRSENITAGLNKSVQQAVLEWQGDAPHLNTMLSPNLSEIGAGVAFVGEYVYYTIDCAAPTNGGLQQSHTPAPGATQAPTRLYVPPLASTIVPSTPDSDGKLIHAVRPGETLWLIAISYGVKIVDIRRLNNMSEAEAIYPGEKLLIRLESTSGPTTLSMGTVASTATITPPSEIASVPTKTPLPLTISASATLEIHAEAPGLAQESLVSLNSSMLILGAIIVAALALAAVFVRAGRKI